MCSPWQHHLCQNTAIGSKKSDNSDSDRSLFAYIVTLAWYIGPWVSEYVQTTQSKVNHHTYPSGRQVIKAFFPKEFAFFDKSWCCLRTVNDSSFEVANTVRITWHIEKNHQNGHTITLSSNSAYPDLCPVRSTLRLVLSRARQLKQPDTMPLGSYRTKKSPLVYLTASRMATLIWEAVKKVCLGISAKDLNRYSAHLLRVWAYVLLDKTGKSPDYIWKRLCWMGNSFWMYLHNTTRTSQSPASIEPGKFDPATRTACWHHAEHAHEWRHRWCRYGQILWWNRLNSILIFITNNSLHTIIILVDYYLSVRPAMSRAWSAIALPHCQRTKTNPNYPFNYHFLPHLQPVQHLMHWGPTLVPKILLWPSWSTILDPPEGPPQDQ